MTTVYPAETRSQDYVCSIIQLPASATTGHRYRNTEERIMPNCSVALLSLLTSQLYMSKALMVFFPPPRSHYTELENDEILFEVILTLLILFFLSSP